MWHKEKGGDNAEGEEQEQGGERSDKGKGGSAVTVAEAKKICKRLHKNEIATKTKR